MAYRIINIFYCMMKVCVCSVLFVLLLFLMSKVIFYLDVVLIADSYS